MPEDVGATPFPDGWEPDDDHDHGVSDDEFASVVFDEAFVQAATVRELSAVERLLAAAEARAEAAETEARRTQGHRPHTTGHDRRRDTDDDVDDLDDLDDPDVLEARYSASGSYGVFGSYGKQSRWHRPVAWMLAVVMGVGMVALAFAAVYRGTSSGGSRDQVPAPTSTGPGQSGVVTPSAPVSAGSGQGGVMVPSVSAEQAQSAVAAVPRTP